MRWFWLLCFFAVWAFLAIDACLTLCRMLFLTRSSRHTGLRRTRPLWLPEAAVVIAPEPPHAAAVATEVCVVAVPAGSDAKARSHGVSLLPRPGPTPPFVPCASRSQAKRSPTTIIGALEAEKFTIGV